MDFYCQTAHCVSRTVKPQISAEMRHETKSCKKSKKQDATQS